MRNGSPWRFWTLCLENISVGNSATLVRWLVSANAVDCLRWISVKILPPPRYLVLITYLSIPRNVMFYLREDLFFLVFPAHTFTPISWYAKSEMQPFPTVATRTERCNIYNKQTITGCLRSYTVLDNIWKDVSSKEDTEPLRLLILGCGYNEVDHETGFVPELMELRAVLWNHEVEFTAVDHNMSVLQVHQFSQVVLTCLRTSRTTTSTTALNWRSLTLIWRRNKDGWTTSDLLLLRLLKTLTSSCSITQNPNTRSTQFNQIFLGLSTNNCTTILSSPWIPFSTFSMKRNSSRTATNSSRLFLKLLSQLVHCLLTRSLTGC